MTEAAISNKPLKATIKLSEIKIDGGLYPRVKGHDPELVQHYARDMDEIEAAGKLISINAEGVLIDGKHRYLAYKKLNDSNMDAEISVYRYDDIVSPVETFRLACALQELGRSLSNDDRVDSAKKLYALGESSQAEIAKALHVNQSTVAKWLSRTLKDEKVRKKDAAFGLWSSCHTQAEIGEAVGVDQKTVTNWNDDFRNLCAGNNFLNSHDFTPPIYNIWSTKTKSNTVDHFGNSEPQWVDNLLYLYTDPGDVVVDPFAGSGSTIDVCKKRGRRYFVSDRKPIVERR